MRRRALMIAGLVVALAGCGAGKEASPLPETVEGSLPKAPQVAGNAQAGKSLFTAQGCGSCHTYQPAGSKGKIGPDLDKLEASAKQADQGSVDEYTHTSIANPNAYIHPGYPKGVMPNYGEQLKDKQIADLVAFLTAKQS